MSNPVEPRKPLSARTKAGEPLESILSPEALKAAARVKTELEIPEAIKKTIAGTALKIPLPPTAPPTDPAGDLRKARAVAAQVSEALDELVVEIAREFAIGSPWDDATEVALKAAKERAIARIFGRGA